MKLEQCPDCQGQGIIPIGDHYVTHDMAIDAGMPELEGSYHSTEYEDCKRCGKTGAIDIPDVAGKVTKETT